jgi:hypothetical protein
MVKVFGARLARLSTRRSAGTRAAAIAVLLLGSLPSPSFAAGQPVTLSQIFAPTMLEAKVAAFEEVAGKAWKVVTGPDKRSERRIYKVERCAVEAGIGNGSVQSLYLKLSDRCTFDLAAFFPTRQRLATASKLTFGEAERVLGAGTIVGICLRPCGKTYRPGVFEHIEGSQADNFIDTILEVRLVDAVSIRAASEWAKSKQGDGDDGAKGARFNCDRRYDELAHRLFDKIRITAIRIGYNFTEPWQCD